MILQRNNRLPFIPGTARAGKQHASLCVIAQSDVRCRCRPVSWKLRPGGPGKSGPECSRPLGELPQQGCELPERGTEQSPRSKPSPLPSAFPFFDPPVDLSSCLPSDPPSSCRHGSPAFPRRCRQRTVGKVSSAIDAKAQMLAILYETDHRPDAAPVRCACDQPDNLHLPLTSCIVGTPA